MDSAEWRPLLAALALPPAGPLLLAALGWLIVRRRRWFGSLLLALGLAALWLLSCHAIAVQLSQGLLRSVPALPPATVAEHLKFQQVQAIVVLGGGVQARVPELDGPLPSPHTTARVLYGAWLARQSGLPLAFAGGLGWANAGDPAHRSEAESVRLLLQRIGAPAARWTDGSSRDTVENARNIVPLLQRAGVRRVALVTSAVHMPRAVLAFENAGMPVLPAPTDFIVPHQRPLLEWLPSAHGLQASQSVLREWLALRMKRY